jgi:cell fate (sporulation/competence/biofilm development) regulator YmcA (YheA/YmcA/DUF963 family)
MQLQEIEQQVSTTTDLFDKATQLWTSLEEDQQVQQWDKEEERINAAIKSSRRSIRQYQSQNASKGCRT